MTYPAYIPHWANLEDTELQRRNHDRLLESLDSMERHAVPGTVRRSPGHGLPEGWVAVEGECRCCAEVWTIEVEAGEADEFFGVEVDDVE
jgi:hypothetical protein